MRQANLSRFILCIDEERNCSPDDLPAAAQVVWYRRRIDPRRDVLGLRSFLDRSHYHAPFGILVTMTDDVDVADPDIVTVSLPSLLLMR